MGKATFIAMGIDVGGTKTAFGVVRFPAGEVLVEKEIPTGADRSAKKVLDDIVRAASKLAVDNRLKGATLSAVGFGICELVGRRGEILSHNLLNWKTAQIQRQFADLAPVTLEADVRAGALAEALFGAGKSYRIFLYVTVGTGISCSLVIDGVPYLGMHGATGTMASSSLTWVCETCGDINKRTLEQIASGPALVSRLNQEQPGAAVTGQDVLAAAAQGNATAECVIRSAATALGSTISLLVNVLDPEAVIIGGGLGLSKGIFWKTLIESTRNHIWSDIHRDVPILPAATGVRCAMIGAAAAAWKAHMRQASAKR
ncbi:MAG TPA: ROK family protein [Candidatus Limnocylindrales bacterium]|nr:ROK family protein [Candidatus Limnocylindrales bacterium]